MSVNQNNISSLKEDILFWIIGLENNYFKCYLSLEKNGNNNHSLIFQFLFRKLIIFLSISFNPSKKNFLYQKLSNLKYNNNSRPAPIAMKLNNPNLPSLFTSTKYKTKKTKMHFSPTITSLSHTPSRLSQHPPQISYNNMSSSVLPPSH